MPTPWMDWMDDARNTKKIHQANLNQKWPEGRPKARWKDDVEIIQQIRKLLTGDK